MQNVEDAPRAWGGARKGAGRKKMEKGKYYGFASTPEVDAILQAVEGSKAAFINHAIAQYAKSRQQ